MDKAIRELHASGDPGLLNLDFSLLGPEIIFFLLVLFLFAGSILEGRYPGLRKSSVLLAAPLAAIAAAASAAFAFGRSDYLFFYSYRVDGLSQFFKILISGGYAVAALNAMGQKTLERDRRLDYYLFLTLSAWGLIILSSASELLTVYLALELASYSLYAIIPARARSKGAAEAGLKYILFGAAATALSLYGLSWIMAAQGTTYISLLAQADWSMAASPLAVMGLSLFLAGMFFKLALFPFHFWCPDVYQGASNETALYVATLPKLGAVIVLIRLAALLKPGLELVSILAALSAISVTYGNLCALAQKDLKRMLGFSSVAHAGYILAGLVSGSPEGLAAAAFYAMAYLLMNLLCFWILCRISPDGRNLSYDHLNGLSARSPILAMALAAAAFSLVGLPPTVGFIGKLWIISSLWGHGYNWLVVVICLNSAIAIYYYLSLVRHAYTEAPLSSLSGQGQGSMALADTGAFSQSGALLLGLLVLLLGIAPGPVYGLILKAASGLF
jgi:NADH-quinone oxidoreductase subunit N